MSATAELVRVSRITNLIRLDVLNQAMYVDAAYVHEEGRVFLQVHCYRPDTYTGEFDWGAGGKAYLDEGASEDTIVAAAFGLLKAYVEHEAREGFTYQGLRVYGPHMTLATLMDAARASAASAPASAPEEVRA